MASSPVNTGDLPGDNGDELQSLALELYDAAQVKTAWRNPLYFRTKSGLIPANSLAGVVTQSYSDYINQHSKAFLKNLERLSLPDGR